MLESLKNLVIIFRGMGDSRSPMCFVAASQYSSTVYIEVADKQVNAKSIMGMMSLRLTPGEEITVVANGADEEEAAKGIETFLVNVKNK